MARGGWALRLLDIGAEHRQAGVEQTTSRLRQLVDGLEGAARDRDELALARLVAPGLLAQVIRHGGELEALGVRWEPARRGLRWTASRRHPDAAGQVWVKIRFEDLTCHSGGTRTQAAIAQTRELELEVDTTTVPWRLCRAVDLGPR